MYCTPERKVFIDAYLEDRRRAGEEITKDPPLIRDVFDPKDKEQVKNPRHLSTFTLDSNISRVVIRAGLRVSSHDPHTRQTNILNPTFQKFFFRQVGKASVDPVVREFLIVHK